jgi:hypothetical protein
MEFRQASEPGMAGDCAVFAAAREALHNRSGALTASLNWFGLSRRGADRDGPGCVAKVTVCP